MNIANMRRKLLHVIPLLALVLCLCTACGAIKMSFTMIGDDTTIDVTGAEDGYFAESQDFSVGSGKVIHVDSTLKEGKLKIEFTEVFVFYNDNGPDDIMHGDIAETITIGPDDKQTVRLQPGDYIMQVTVEEKANGKVTVKVEKE